MEKYPMKTVSVPKNIIWGGTRLKEEYNKEAPFERIAESWELTVRDDGMSVIENGPYAGMTLKEYLKSEPTACGESAKGEKFPLLVKFIDAGDDLSIQVHPDDAFAAGNGGEGKTEMWYITDASSEASLIYGLRDGVDCKDFGEYVRDGKTADALRRVSVKKGETYFIPSGQIHAICRGVTLAEIQQNSNTTYRIYDYDRVGKDGKKRELHTDKALKVIKKYPDDEINAKRLKNDIGRRIICSSGEVLCDCIYFRATKIASPAVLNVDRSSFASLLFLEADNASVSCGGETVNVVKGDHVFVPAGSGAVSVDGKAEFIVSEV